MPQMSSWREWWFNFMNKSGVSPAFEGMVLKIPDRECPTKQLHSPACRPKHCDSQPGETLNGCFITVCPHDTFVLSSLSYLFSFYFQAPSRNPVTEAPERAVVTVMFGQRRNAGWAQLKERWGGKLWEHDCDPVLREAAHIEFLRAPHSPHDPSKGRRQCDSLGKHGVLQLPTRGKKNRGVKLHNAYIRQWGKFSMISEDLS